MNRCPLTQARLFVKIRVCGFKEVITEQVPSLSHTYSRGLQYVLLKQLLLAVISPPFSLSDATYVRDAGQNPVH